MKIAIITSGHPPYDERIFYKFGLSLKKYGYDVAVICSTREINTETEGIKVIGFEGKSLSKREKVASFLAEIDSFSPSLLICCEPLTILAADEYKRNKKESVKIIYDITEYYPHQNMLNQYFGISRLFHYLRFSLFNIYVSNLVNYLFIGEPAKAKFYYIAAPAVKKVIIGYYPPKTYFQYYPPHFDGKSFTIFYAGEITEARGFTRYLNLVEKAAERFPDKIFNAKIIGSGQENCTDKIDDILKSPNIRVTHREKIDYKEYSLEFRDVDLCIDLREKNIVFNRSLPIKVFDYLAGGRPFIFSNLDSLKGFNDLEDAGLLIDPEDLGSALGRIEFYLTNPSMLEQHSLNARKLFEDKYNWEIEEQKLLKTIHSMFRKP